MTKSKLKLSVILILFIISVLLVPLTLGKYSSTYTRTVTLNISKPTYTVVFHSNTNPDQTSTQSFTYGTAQNLNTNSFTNGNSIFVSWNTAADGSGTEYQNGVQVNNLTSVNNGTVDLYAQWLSNVCEVNGVQYDTINTCLTHISANNQQTELKMIADVVLGTNDRIHIDNGKNVLLNLNGHTIQNEQGVNIPIIEAVGTITVRNGTLHSTAGQAVINLDVSTGKVYVEDVTITATGSKQAIYNNAGYLEIRDGSIISSTSSNRAAVQTQANGTTVILGGSITSTRFYGVENHGTLTIGDKDGTVSRTNPEIRGTYGVFADANYNFYDGILKGKTLAVNDENYINDIETGHETAISNEVINNTNYQTMHLVRQTIVIYFDGNGGQPDEASRRIEPGTAIGTLPSGTNAGFFLDGWYDDPVGGNEITATTVFNAGTTIYAHWGTGVAKINTTYYQTLQLAIDNVPNTNTRTTIIVLKDIDNENLVVSAGQNIDFNLGSHTLTNSAGIIIHNSGTIEIRNGYITRTGANDQNRVIQNESTGNVTISGGEIKSSSHQAIRNYGTMSITGGKIWLSKGVDQGVINNESTGSLSISGGEILGSKRQAVYNDGGTLTISGTVTLSNGNDGATANRACVQNHSGTTTISGGTISSPATGYPAVLNESTMAITGGTITSTGQYGVSNTRTLTIGVRDGNIDQSSPTITGKTYGVNNTSTFNFFDGIIKGISNSVNGTITRFEDNAHEVNGTEVIDGQTYITKTQSL